MRSVNQDHGPEQRVFRVRRALIRATELRALLDMEASVFQPLLGPLQQDGGGGARERGGVPVSFAESLIREAGVDVDARRRALLALTYGELCLEPDVQRRGQPGTLVPTGRSVGVIATLLDEEVWQVLARARRELGDAGCPTTAQFDAWASENEAPAAADVQVRLGRPWPSLWDDARASRAHRPVAS